MNTEEVEKEYCSRCPSYKYGCGFITRGLQDICVQLSDYTDGYERGYETGKKEVIAKACKYLQDHREEVETEDNGIAGWISNEFIEKFSKYLEE